MKAASATRYLVCSAFLDDSLIISRHIETRCPGAPSLLADNHNGLSGGGSVVVLQQPPETLSLFHFPSLMHVRRIGAD